MNLKEITYAEIREIFIEMSNKDYMYTSSLIIIGKHFLEYFFSNDIYKMPFKEIRENFISAVNREDFENVPNEEEAFFKFICNEYLDLKFSPSVQMLQYYNMASNDLKVINERIKNYEKDIEKLNRMNRKLTNEEGYEKLLLQYFIELNIEAKEEIIEFLTYKIKNHALNNSQEKPKICANWRNHFPYNYRLEPAHYKKETITDLHNKFQELPISEYNRILIMYKEDNKNFYNSMQDYILNYHIIDKIYNFIHSHYRLNKREEILRQALFAYEDGETLIFCNVIPLQIEGIFHDYCLELGISETDLLASPLHEKLKIITSKDNNFRDFEYFNFKFPIIRNKVAHGNLFKEDDKKLSRFLLLDLYSACKLLATSDSLKINKTVNILKEYEEEKSFKNLIKSIILIQDIYIPEYYNLEKTIEEVKNRFLNDDVWNYLHEIVNKKNEVLNRGIYSIGIYLKEEGINKEKCIDILRKTGETNNIIFDLDLFIDELNMFYLFIKNKK